MVTLLMVAQFPMPCYPRSGELRRTPFSGQLLSFLLDSDDFHTDEGKG